MKFHYRIIYVMSMCIISGMHAQQWKLFFDLPIVLFGTDEIGMSKEIGRASALWYAISEWKDPRALKDKAFAALDTLGKQKTAAEQIVRTPEGHPLPLILCEWLAGTKQLSAIVQQINQQFTHLNDRANFFSSSREYMLISNALQTILNPQILAQYIRPMPSALKTMAKCSTLGKQSLYIVGNWDKHSFKHIVQSHTMQQLLHYFSPKNIFISGTSHVLLPDMSVHEQIIKRDSLNKDDIIFVSAMSSHIAAARKMGYKTFFVQSAEYHREFINFLNSLHIL